MATDCSLMNEAKRLGAAVNGHPENLPAVMPRLLELLEAAPTPRCRAEVVRALGHAWTEEACLAVLPYADDEDDEVRLEVARTAPGGLDSEAAEERVAKTLIQLSRDDVDDIRDWATFGLGSILEIDTPAVRQALADRLDDEKFDTACEALVGLAERGDERAFDRTMELLQAESVPRLAVDAARALADQRLLGALRSLELWWDVDPPLLQMAIEACEGVAKGTLT